MPKICSYHSTIYEAISLFNTGNDPSDKPFDNLKEYQDYIDLHFSHLITKEHNIFSVKSKTPETCRDIYLTKDALERLVGTAAGGWLNDIIFQQVINLLTFSGEYCSASK